MAEPASIRIELPPFSQFTGTPAFQIAADVDGSRQNVAVFGLKQSPVTPDPSDILFTVPLGGARRLDLISQKHYGTPELWWVIAQCNPELDPLAGPSVTDVLRVPTRLRLASLGVLSV